MLLPGERIDQLFADDIQIIQSKEVFSFSLDAVLLANFPVLPKKGRIVDLCAGNGAVGLFASRKTNAEIIQIELQNRLADMGKRSIQLNQLDKQIQMIELDLKQATTVVKPDSVDLVLCNPPYFKELPASQKNPNPHLAIARHEIHTSLNEVVSVSAKLLKTNGRLAMVHRPDRFLDILHAMEAENIAPKRVRFIYPKAGKEANTLLIEGIKQGKKDGFRVLPPLFTYDEDNNYLPEMKAMLYGN
ncbi:tRNA1(Val) (adenine(37)-N6)-methyltransferase [Enterococcus sp. 5H]|uniref:tRNA1(Val) (adenine(37)-N6)-methyltransferase n=1 Tax=Enterococcus sp. 5H TaxID=1229490 RepID=UPI002302B2CD|nr:tRNA1(Val) (adenine(37)-N6)-methyltransferase [Enterococcus sp. 5H]MDA9472730.1 tRNA (adenine37-N(6))-methyltransferase TrmN6 [Enterococcus sp. 5H]